MTGSTAHPDRQRRYLCAGMDLKAGAEGHQNSTEEFMEVMGRVPNVHWQALLRDNRPNKPLILAVEGFALAGGTEVLQGTDIRVAADNAIFGITEVARGLYPMSGSTVRLRRQIPYCLAAEMLLCGEHISAQRALEIGLINKIVPAGQTLAAAREYAARICANGPLAVRAVTCSLRGAPGAHGGGRGHGGLRRTGRPGVCLGGCEGGHARVQGKTAGGFHR